MKTYKVALAFTCSYIATVTVEADTLEDACEAALESNPNFEPADDSSDTFIEAIGDNGTAWSLSDPLHSALPIPARFRQTAQA